MGKCFSSHILHFSNSATPTLTSSPLPLAPNAHLPADLPIDNAALISGFSGLFPESSIPVSPTLQLNCDLSALSRQQLTAIGRAELNRHLGINFASHIQQPDNRVAVMAARAASLHRFMDQYGAILEIIPILTREFAAGIPTAEQLEIRQTSQGIQVAFLARSPIDTSRCTYCRACGAACGQHCLDPDLFLDFTRCNLCSDCMRACPVQAIDLHARQRHEFQVPALLDLDEIQPHTTESHPVMPVPDALAQILASLHPCRIEETVVCEPASCQYTGSFAAGCDLCCQACGHHAIDSDQDGIRVDPLACEECGACVAACPTGAMQFLRFTDRAFAEYVQEIDLDPGHTVVIGAESSLRALWWQSGDQRLDNILFLEYPEPGALHLFHFLLLIARGAARILVLARPENTQLQDQVDQVNTLLAPLFPDDVPVRLTGLDKIFDLPDRREPFPLAARYSDSSFAGRRDKIASLLAFFMAQGLKLDRETGARFREFGTLACDPEQCSLCLACVGQCKTGALHADSEQFLLQITDVLCVQCEACVQLCPEKALRLVPGLRLEPAFFEAGTLARAEPMRCADCGKVFGTRQSFERVMGLLDAQGKGVDRDLFSCCEDCRVVRLYGEMSHE